MTFEDWFSVGDEAGESGWTDVSEKEIARSAWAAAYKEGQKAIMESCLTECDSLFGSMSMFSDRKEVEAYNEAINRCIEVIRALQTKGEK